MLYIIHPLNIGVLVYSLPWTPNDGIDEEHVPCCADGIEEEADTEVPNRDPKEPDDPKELTPGGPLEDDDDDEGVEEEDEGEYETEDEDADPKPEDALPDAPPDALPDAEEYDGDIVDTGDIGDIVDEFKELPFIEALDAFAAFDAFDAFVLVVELLLESFGPVPADPAIEAPVPALVPLAGAGVEEGLADGVGVRVDGEGVGLGVRVGAGVWVGAGVRVGPGVAVAGGLHGGHLHTQSGHGVHLKLG